MRQALADPDLYRRDPKNFQAKTTRIGAAEAEIEAADTELLELEIFRGSLGDWLRLYFRRVLRSQ